MWYRWMCVYSCQYTWLVVYILYIGALPLITVNCVSYSGAILEITKKKYKPPLQFHVPLLMREKIFATKNYSNFACQLNKLPECGLPAFTT